ALSIYLPPPSIVSLLLAPSIALLIFSFFFSFNYPPSTEIYTLSLHDALPILKVLQWELVPRPSRLHNKLQLLQYVLSFYVNVKRSEEHTSELQSRFDLVCRLLLEKKKIMNYYIDKN